MIHNENSRVKIPAIVHLTRLGYVYLPRKEHKDAHRETNIFKSRFRDGLSRVNGRDISEAEAESLIAEITSALAGNDLGKVFFKMLHNGIGDTKLVDLDDTSRNTFHVVTELTYRNEERDDEFRPDITILINGMPLAFVEVKKPNNKEGIIAERDRIDARYRNAAFRRFANITQLMIFSNNMEYDDSDPRPIEGAFYASTSYDKLFFSRWREEDTAIFTVPPADEDVEAAILKDNNLVSIKNSAEYKTNWNHLTPTHKMLTSLLSPTRLMTLIKYGFAYVDEVGEGGVIKRKKHIMRYQQFFAMLALVRRLESGGKNGVIWHTQGSGKTAFAYHCVRYLRDWYAKSGTVAKFYFIVDRIDLMDQASSEFKARGLSVERVASREAFVQNIKTIGASGTSGEDTITVVNIQRFSSDSVARDADYDIHIQRVYFLDEAHRSYDPKGSFLADLKASDRDAVMIALTGTPLIGSDHSTKAIFGDYIHKYYYNSSIADGFTLKLLREGIKTEYRAQLQSVLDELEKVETAEGTLDKSGVFAHPKYAAALADYVACDFRASRIAYGDDSIGAMIVCNSADQARSIDDALGLQEEFSHKLILHDEDDKQTRREHQEDFKKGKIDILVVYNMLLTGFDAPRLKKLYLDRMVKSHNLLQTLTRVNRPYKNFRYGYVVDFADIRAEFDKTNRDYFNELQAEIGADEFERYSNIFKSPEEIAADLDAIRERLFSFAIDNAENFRKQIDRIDDKRELLAIRKALDAYRELSNIIRLHGYEDLADKLTLEKSQVLLNEVRNRINAVNFKECLDDDSSKALLNLALDQIEFSFRRISKSELVVADKFQQTLEHTRRELLERCLDPKDPNIISLLEELKRILKKKHIEEYTADEMTETMSELERIRQEAARINEIDARLREKYLGDAKFVRAHKRLIESLALGDITTYGFLLGVKSIVDPIVLNNAHVIDNQAFFGQSVLRSLIDVAKSKNMNFDKGQYTMINSIITNEYRDERGQGA